MLNALRRLNEICAFQAEKISAFQRNNKQGKNTYVALNTLVNKAS